MMEKAALLFSKEDLGRLTEAVRGGRKEVTVDLHGLTVREARRMLLNMIAMDRGGYRLRIIHGYHRGTGIKEMVRRDLKGPRVAGVAGEEGNPGVTLADVLRAA